MNRLPPKSALAVPAQHLKRTAVRSHRLNEHLQLGTTGAGTTFEFIANQLVKCIDVRKSLGCVGLKSCLSNRLVPDNLSRQLSSQAKRPNKKQPDQPDGEHNEYPEHRENKENKKEARDYCHCGFAQSMRCGAPQRDDGSKESSASSADCTDDELTSLQSGFEG